MCRFHLLQAIKPPEKQMEQKSSALGSIMKLSQSHATETTWVLPSQGLRDYLLHPACFHHFRKEGRPDCRPANMIYGFDKTHPRRCCTDLLFQPRLLMLSRVLGPEQLQELLQIPDDLTSPSLSYGSNQNLSQALNFPKHVHTG
ncbi:uncharacterized protein LOC105734733 [Mus musculus]|uniref:Predicted gene 13030 n=1 Tax=Mus musculus TaxID=10090 RepID=A2APQ6_MOUSE|nr:uncharacterized protein LOC105734733 [Mus musculus]|eukprot:NP_001295416.1 uncharacterized protein LOC105734733 [Mus musculus]